MTTLRPIGFSRGMAQGALALANMRENCKRDLPWFVEASVTWDRDLVVVAGGPSLRNSFEAIRKRQVKGACVVALNGARRLLKAHGIIPDVIACVDPSEACLGFFDDEDDGCVYLIGSICHPKVLDKLQGRRVVLWHPDCAIEGQRQILDDHPEKPGMLIGGGNTVGLRMLNVGHLLGFRTFHFYGMDSCYAPDGSDHAYAKHDGVEPDAIEIDRGGARYRCSPWMARQAEEFKGFFAQFSSFGCKIHIHGEGLIPDLAREMKRVYRRAA